MTIGGTRFETARPIDASGGWGSLRAGMAFAILLVALVYSNTLHSPLIFDDIPHIVENSAIHLTRIDGAGLWRAAFDSPHPNRPVANISFALNYRIHGLSPPGYHLVNLFIHLVTGFLFYGLAYRTLTLIDRPGTPAAEEKNRLTALAAAVLWMVHPLQTQSVTYTVQRMNSLAALFYLSAVLFYLCARTSPEGWRRFAAFSAALGSGLLAVGSKEIAVTLPVFLFIYEWFFFQNLDSHWLRCQGGWLVALAVVGAGACWIYLDGDPVAKILASYRHRDFTLPQRLLTQPRVILLYLSLLVFPHPGRLNLDHHIAVSRSLVSPPTTLISVAAVAGLFVVAAVTARRHRLLSFAVMWYLGNLVIESSVLGLELAFEHRNYLPSMFLFLVLVRAGAHIPLDRRVRAMLLGVAVLVLGLWTFERNGVWGSDLALWGDCAAKSPGKARPHNKYGLALQRRGRLKEAMAQYRYALAADSGYLYAYINMADALFRQGRIEEALDYQRKALHLSPDDPRVLVNLGATLARQGRFREAAAHFGHALDRTPNNAKARLNLGLALMAMGKDAEAVDVFRGAPDPRQNSAAIHYSLGNALSRLGRLDEAIKAYRTALVREPDNAAFHNNLGIALARRGRRAEAVGHFRIARGLDPTDAKIRENLRITQTEWDQTP